MFIKFIFLIFSPVFANESACQHLLGTCDYYTCLSEKLHCSPKEYPLAFGFHYCEKFDHQNAEYSESGKEFLKKIKRCLQEELEKTSELTCARADEGSPNHHLVCYKKENYCALPAKDKVLISTMVIKKMIEDKRFRKTAGKITQCPSRK